MKYALMIFLPAGTAARITTAEEAAIQHTCAALTEDTAKAGHYLGSMRLAAEQQAKCLRMPAGKPVLTDGPFAETKEFLAGLYIVECDTMEEAAAYAQRHPGAALGTVEIRPIVDFDLG
jgi:hypothetical protein